MRICPHCYQQSELAICPTDGFQTVDSQTYAPAEPEALLGSVFQERYRLEALLGKGGFGAVYKATQLSVNRIVAVKILRGGAASTLKDAARFQQEARAIGAVKHPNVVALVDFGQTQDGRLFLVTEFLEGRDLSRVIQEDGPLDADRVVDIGLQLLDGLEACHTAGILHRDLKPENLILSRRGRHRDFVSIFDFGIAKVATADGVQSLTATGIAIGTPKYMSPEQCLSSELTPQSDLYAVGLVLYELLSGNPVFVRSSPTAFLVSQIQDLPELPYIGEQQLGGPLVDFIMQCLEKDAQRRPRSGAEAMSRLEACRGAPVSKRPRPAPPARPRTVADIPAPNALLASQPPIVTGHVAKAVRPAPARKWLLPAGLAVVAAGAVALVLALSSKSSAPTPVDEPTSEPTKVATTVATTPDVSQATVVAVATDVVATEVEPIDAAAPEVIAVVTDIALEATSPVVATTRALRFESDPPGARVVRRDSGAVAEICARTPCDATLPLTSEPAVFVASIVGRSSATQKVVITAGADAQVVKFTLRRIEKRSEFEPPP